MIYLIGGPPRCGKTTLAQKLSEKLGIIWAPVDSLEGVASGYVSEVEYADFFPKNVMRDITKNSNDLLFEKYSITELVDAYKKQGESLQRALGKIIEIMVYTNQDFILEGYQVVPAFVTEMENKYGSKRIRSVFLSKSNTYHALSTLRASNNPDDWAIKQTKDSRTLGKIAEFISLYSLYFISECEDSGKHCIDYVDGFENHLNESMTLLLEG